MSIALGLLVALFYGSGDFFGGVAAKRASAATVVVGSFAVALGLLAVATGTWALVDQLPIPTGRDLALGVASGFVGPLALGLLYHGLASGRMSVVAPITAVVAAIVPLAWGLNAGERPSAIALGGVALALTAVGLIAGAPAHEDHPADAPDPGLAQLLGPAVLSGLGFGVIYVLLGETSDHAGLWPLVAARPTSVALAVTFLIIAAARARSPIRDRLIAPRSAWPAIAAAGVFDVSANASFLAASNAGLLSIVSVLASLYPAATVVLARVVLGERLHRLQIVGLGLASAGIVAMAAT